MPVDSNKLLFWAPRVLCILFIGFVSLFALDVFQEGHGPLETLYRLAIHLIPSFALVAALAVAWRWEWVGAASFSLFGLFFLWIVRSPFWGKAIFALPCFLTAWLFLVNWRRRVHDRHAPAASA